MNSHGKFISKYLYCVFRSALLLAAAFSMLSCAGKNTDRPKSPPGVKIYEGAININIADSKELESLPGVGPKTAKEIVEHRMKYGNFRRVEHLMLLRGISDKRFRKFRSMVRTE